MISFDLFFAQLPVSQINGCRRFGPREEEKPFVPSGGSEIFIARIPKAFPHKELVKICFHAGAGQLYDVRLMINFMRDNKGYAFVRYMNPEVAVQAIQFLHGFQLGSQGKLVAMPSTDHRTLMLSGVSSVVTIEEVEQIFREIDGAELISVTKDVIRGSEELPVFYLRFASHRSAALMKKSSWKEVIPQHWGHCVHLSWQPNDEVDQRIRFKNEKKYLSLMKNDPVTRLPNVAENNGTLSRVTSSFTNREQRLPQSFPLEASAQMSFANRAQRLPQTLQKEASVQVSFDRVLPLPQSLQEESLFQISPIPDTLSPLSRNSLKLWSPGMSSGEKRLFSEPPGIWGGAPLLPRDDQRGNSQWLGIGEGSASTQQHLTLPLTGAVDYRMFQQDNKENNQWQGIGETSSSNQQSFKLQPTTAVDYSFPLFLQRNTKDESTQTDDFLLLSYFGRSIRGRRDDDLQVPKTMRF